MPFALAKPPGVAEGSTAMSPALSLYLALTSLADPAARLLLRRRLAAGKEDAARLPERLGHPSLPRPGGPLVWFHAASVGESLSILPLVERLRAQRADVSVLVTSGTVTSAALLAERLPAGAVHQYVPVDVRDPVRRFLHHWKPDLAVWVESEIWPRLLRSVRDQGIPALLLNARLSGTTRRRWARLPGAASALFATFDYVQAQDGETADAVTGFGVPRSRIVVAGSFKRSAAPLPFDEVELERLRAATAGRFVWVAASTHPGDEALAIEAHHAVLESRPDALLIVVPRHPERGDEVAALLAASLLNWTRRRAGLPQRQDAAYLADTLGELGLWYRLGAATYLGGSRGEVGGHNPFEPIALGIPVLHGPDTPSFAAIYDELVAARATRCVRSADELGRAILALGEETEGADIAKRAAAVVGRGSEALDRAIEAVLLRLPPAGP